MKFTSRNSRTRICNLKSSASKNTPCFYPVKANSPPPNKKTAFYIEHDELEKVNTAMTKFNSYFELEEYTEAIPELENCQYILNHIKEKESMQFINLF